MPSPSARSSRPARLAALAFGLFVLASSSSGRQPGQAPAPQPAPLPVPGLAAAQPPKNGDAEIPEYTLGECIAIAIERQPTLRASRSSQQATSAGVHALDNIGKLGQLVAKDLPVRKEQAQRGAVAAAADVQKTHNEIVHDVTRLYYTAVYARQGSLIAEDVVAQVELLTKIGRDLLNSPQPGTMTKAKLNAMEIGLEDARKLLRTAQLGERKAYGALREMMAAQDTGPRFKVKDRELPILSANVPLTEELIVELALCRRPELALAAAGADAFRLEVYAQGAVRFKKSVPTLAIGGDIKAREVPATVRDLAQQYKPGAIIPEMPPQLVGNQADRVARAMAYSQRADAVFEKARNLVRLEAENAYLEYELASKNVLGGKRKFDFGKDLMEYVRARVDNPNVEREQLVRGYIDAAKAQSDYVESVWQYLLTLAHLERVTAGGVRPDFPGR
ncbi:TolC family protein [Urbifossiella limnaea]|uniref:Outer membrane efflux protein n=1 Tax=Urbifossiella limnaea TaxID=2528023 RepID=A0A517XV94_9BACT|nr:TolC family protein [Urbifossiella limnaea]QDU21435.1 Outer membrane efflux protein [Urbifossiella limnaea]